MKLASPSYRLALKDYQGQLLNPFLRSSTGIFSGMDLNGAGSRGIYWSRSLHASNTRNAYYLGFDFRSFITDYSYRFSGLSVRPVRVN